MRTTDRRQLRLCAIVTALALCGGSASSAPWLTTLGESDGAVPRDAALRADGGLVTAGTLRGGAWLASVGPDGTVSWNITIDEDVARPRMRSVRALAGTPDGGATVLLGDALNRHAAQATLLHVDGDGVMTWGSSWSVGASTDPQALIRLADGSFVIAVEDTVAKRLVLVRRDAVGAPLWAKTLSGATVSQLAGLAPASDGGFLAAVAGKDRTVVLRCTADGQVSWSRALDAPFTSDNALTSITASFAEAPDGDWLMSGACPFLGCGAIAARLDPDGNPRWSRYFVADGSSLTKLFVTSDGGFLAQQWSRVTRLGPDGSWQWTQYLEWYFRYIFGYGALGSGDEILVAGYTDDGFPAFTRLDASGNTSGCLTAVAEPFPSSDFGLTATPVVVALTDVTVAAVACGPWSRQELGTSPPCASGCIPDEKEPDDSVAQSWTFGYGKSTRGGNFCDDAEDWMRIDCCAGATLSIETDRLGASADTVIELFASDRVTLLASDDNGGSGLGSSVTWNASSSGPLYARLSQADGTSGHGRAYRISLDVTPPPARTYMKAVGPMPGDGRRFTGAHGDDGTTLLGGSTCCLTQSMWLTAIAPDGDIAWDASWTFARHPNSSRLVVPAVRPDGGSYIVFGNEWTSSEPFVVTRRAPDGAELWSRNVVPSAASEYASSATIAPDGGVILAGVARDSPGVSEAWVAHVSPDGTLDWARRVGDGRIRWASSVAPATGGGLFLSSANYDSCFVTKIDDGGNVLWERSLDRAGRDGVTISPTSDGGVYFVSTEILRLDAAGTVLWQRKVPATWPAHWSDPPVACSTADGGLVMAVGSLTDYSHIVLFRLDPSGNVAWARLVEARSGIWHRRSIRALPSGDIILSASSYIELQTNPVARVIRLTSEGWLESPCDTVSPVTLGLAESFEVMGVGSATSQAGGGSLRDTSWPLADVVTHSFDDCDCKCGTQSAPNEVSRDSSRQPLRLGSKGHITWERRRASDACWFNVYRGTLSQLPAGDHGQCLASGVALNETSDPSPPPPDDAWFYLVTGESDAGEGPLGPDSLGVSRAITAPCP